ncbi:MAG: hypothetical protein CTY35_00300 [Methylotenera sp.]|uniref:hypothetical protein n=1 Tax=Methylotenera sp. TaxID=2051956 RepID=UPI000D478DCD|nr:hypothetical protein [Methylotenera sp.]PPD02155.1 MAG: hypothetical protein CTY35_00300 [Methylotenera sp.]
MKILLIASNLLLLISPLAYAEPITENADSTRYRLGESGSNQQANLSSLEGKSATCTRAEGSTTIVYTGKVEQGSGYVRVYTLPYGSFDSGWVAGSAGRDMNTAGNISAIFELSGNLARISGFRNITPNSRNAGSRVCSANFM